MGDNGERPTPNPSLQGRVVITMLFIFNGLSILSPPYREGLGEGLKDTAHGGQLLPTKAAHDARLAEQCLDGRVAGGDGSRMTGGGAAATLAGPRLDGGYATALANE